MKEKTIFALDIGTRSVIGLILEKTDNSYKILDVYIKEHQERSMLDGQIQDVIAVAKVIEEVKVYFERKYGPLESVSVAAAGRSLKTIRTKITQSILGHPPIKQEDILALELSCVQEAQRILAHDESEKDATRYYCVGYSVVNYYLDQSVMINLIDQTGDEVAVEVIATFLPRIVIDNLAAALNRAGLKMDGLTLEPIAAIHILIPPSMRRLNVALVDIGAGTSDIAITADGTIIAYGMVPTAGDEITDGLSQVYLLDFPVAEQLKRDLIKEELLTFTDILGMEHRLHRDEIINGIHNDIRKLARGITERILELNGRAPQAILLIGGGSLTPGIGPILAESLGLPENRVAIRGVDAIQIVVGTHPKLQGPEAITPIGIAVTSQEHPVKYLSLEVNDKPLRLFDLRKLTLGDALIAAGIDIKRIHGKPGLAMTVLINGKLRIIPGSHGTPPILTINGDPAQLNSPIQHGDRIEVIPGQDGQAAKATVKEVIDEINTLDIFLNGKPISFPPMILINGKEVDWDTPLEDRDEILFHIPQTLQDLEGEIGPIDLYGKKIRFSLNSNIHHLEIEKVNLYINGKIANTQTSLKNGDRVNITYDKIENPVVKNVIPEVDLIEETIKVFFNGESVVLPREEVIITVDDIPATLDTPIHEGVSINYFKKQLPTPIFRNVFRYIDYQPPYPRIGHTIKVLRNSLPCDLNEPIAHGDILEIRLESIAAQRPL